MQLDSQAIREAAALVAFGLQPSKRPSHDAEYARLVRRWMDEQAFERIARDVADGLGLRIVDVSDFGVVLAAAPDSPFGLTVADYRQGVSAEERLLHGVVQVGLAAYLYPRSEDLEAEAEVRRVSVRDLEEFLREACASILAASVEHDTPTASPELEKAAAIYDRWPATKQTADARRAAKSTTGLIAHALERLADAGMLRRDGDGDGASYQALRRYRVQLRELAAHEALTALRSAALRATIRKGN
jgi:hypothetical protein